MHLSSSADKVSTLTQTEDLELGHTVELESNINVEPQHNKVLNTTNEIHLERGGRLMGHHLHLLNHTRGSSGIDTASLSPSVSLPEKRSSVSNVASIDSIQVSDGNTVTKCQVEVNPRVIGPVGIDSNTLKQTTSMYPRIVPKINLAPNEIITSGLIKSNLNPKVLIPKLGSESLTSSRGSDVNREQRIVSVFIKQENSENFISQRVNKSGGDGSRDKESKKRRLQNINSGKDNNECTNAKCIKETKNQSIKGVELDSYIEQVACYKCKCCHFLALEKQGVVMHIELVHGSELLGTHRETRYYIKCPGCENVFLSSKSLRVHLLHDHQMGDEELKMLVDVVIRSSCKDAKAKNQFHKKRKGSTITTQACSASKDMPSVKNGVVQVNCSATDMLPDECSKIRVRDLNSEVLPELQDTRVSRSDTTAGDIRNEDSLVSRGASDGDVREGTLVIDDNHLRQQKHAKITVDICEFKVTGIHLLV
jgi:hypothetical protein